MFVLGIMVFSSTVMMPLFLQTLLGYTAESAGLVLSGGGILLFLLMPVAGTLPSKVQARYMIAFGWLCISLAMFYTTQYLNLQISFASASFLRILQVFGLGFLFVPMSLVAYVGMPAQKNNSVAGLINFMRNIGASIGTSMVTTLIARRAQVHQVYLSAHATPGQPTFSIATRGLAQRLTVAGLNTSLATRQSYARLYRSLIAQATTLAYIDTFWVLAIGSGIMFLLSFALKKNEPGAGGEIAAG
jgi:DHA2 family multidrug resistance protein